MRTGVAARAVAAVGLLLPLAGLLVLAVLAVGLSVGFLLAGTPGVGDTQLVQWVVLAVPVAAVAILLAAGVRRTVREGRGALLADSRPVTSDYQGDVLRTVRRLARQADVPTPEVRVRPTSKPLAYTIPRDGEPVLVYSRGLVETLSEPEFEAVLAHEVGHVANRDHRWMFRILAPLLLAEALHELFVTDFFRKGAVAPGVMLVVQVPVALVATVAVPWAEAAAGLFSRGREFAANDAAAALTGDPASLASALEALSTTESGRPPEDLREHAGSLDALNVLPTLADDPGWLRASHPDTGTRVARLRERVGETGTA